MIGAQQQETEPTVEIGAKVYQERCVLCHGMQAMGEGVLPMKLKTTRIRIYLNVFELKAVARYMMW